MKIAPVIRKARLKDIDEDLENLQYWLSRSLVERMAAMTQLRSFTLTPDQRIDKTVVIKRKLHP